MTHLCGHIGIPCLIKWEEVGSDIAKLLLCCPNCKRARLYQWCKGMSMPPPHRCYCPCGPCLYAASINACASLAANPHCDGTRGKSIAAVVRPMTATDEYSRSAWNFVTSTCAMRHAYAIVLPVTFDAMFKLSGRHIEGVGMAMGEPRIQFDMSQCD